MLSQATCGKSLLRLLAHGLMSIVCAQAVCHLSQIHPAGWPLQAGEFQCYDERALASLTEAAAAVEQPEWGIEGPHDAGEYNSWPKVGMLLLLVIAAVAVRMRLDQLSVVSVRQGGSHR